MLISKTVEGCKHLWELVEREEIDYKDPQGKGQCHQPLIMQSGRQIRIPWDNT